MIKNKTKFSKYKAFKINHNSNKKIWLYGYHSVIAAIENINRKKYRLICTKNALNKLSNDIMNNVLLLFVQMLYDNILKKYGKTKYG